MFQTKVVEEIKKHVLCSVIVPENRAFFLIKWEKPVEPDEPQITVRGHARYVLDHEDYRHTFRIRNTYFFATATMVTRTRVSVTFVRTLPVLFNVIVRSYSLQGACSLPLCSL
jgi:hypothetical protein